MAVYYVDQSHNAANDNNSGSETSPFRTIQEAADRVEAGDTVLVKSGTYDPFEITSSGTRDNPIVFSAYTGDEHTAIIDGSGANVRGAIMAEGESHLEIRGFRIQNAPTDGIFIEGSPEGARDILIADNQIDTTGNSGIYAAGVVMGQDIGVDEYRLFDLRIQGNEVTNTNTPDGGNEAISVGGGVDGFDISDNWVHHSDQYGIDIKFGVINGRIHGNTIHDIERHGIYVDTNSRTIENVDIFNNTVFNNNNGIALARESARDPKEPNMQNVDIYDNLVYDNAQFGIMAYKHIRDNETGLFDDIQITSNTIHGNGSDGVHLRGIEDFATNFLVSGNTIFENGNNIRNEIGATVTNNEVSNNTLSIDSDDGADTNYDSSSDLIDSGSVVSEPDDTSSETTTVVASETSTDDSPITFWLVDAASNERVTQLSEGATVDPDLLSNDAYSVEVSTGSYLDVGSVGLQLDDGTTQYENNAPYALFGDRNGNFSGQSLEDGPMTLSATAYSGGNGNGTVLAESSIDVEVSDTIAEAAPGGLFEAHYNVGSGDVVTTEGVLFEGLRSADAGRIQLRDRDQSISGTEDDALYDSFAFGDNFQFDIDVGSTGDYRVELHLSENWHTQKGSRVFDVSLEGETPSSFHDIDVIALTGERFSATTLKSETTVDDRTLSISVDSSVDYGLINAISIYQINEM